MGLFWPDIETSSDQKPDSPKTALLTPRSACQVPPAYLLSSVTSAGTDGPEVLLLPLLSNLVHFPIIVAGGLICGETELGCRACAWLWQ